MEIQYLTPSREHDAPIYLQLYRRYREAIASGKLNPGDRVPSVRSLASELNLARGTVEVAYQMLVSEGYFTTRGTSGTVVSPHLDGLAEPGHAVPCAPDPSPAFTLNNSTSEVLPFQLGLPALDAFPRKAWVRLTGRRLRTLDSAAMIYPDETGYEPLRRTIATYLGISRGIACSHEQVFVTAGYRGALELLDWASRSSAWIIEDDYDSEFRYHGRPLPALKSLDRDGRVLYTGTFSKVLFPGLRLAYLVVPASQVATFRTAAQQYPSAGSILSQAMVADFMEQGHFTRHLRKMRTLYAQRHQFLINALSQALGQRLYVSPQAGGIHVLAYLDGRNDDQTLAAAARGRGLAVHALNDWRMHTAGQGGLLMGFANFKTAEETAISVGELETLLRR